MVNETDTIEGEHLQATIDELVRLAREGDSEAVIGLLSERVPGNRLGETPPPDLTYLL